MAHSIAELKKLTSEQIIEKHDGAAAHTMVGVQYYLDELRYREQSKITDQIWWFTLVVTVATLVGTILSVLIFLKT